LNNFEEFGFVEPIMKAIHETGYSIPTPIQQVAIPPVMDGFDLMGCAQTGTGKTAAFALPTLQRLAVTKRDTTTSLGYTTRRPIRALVLAPTRELAAQIEESFLTYGKFLSLRTSVVHGGVSQTPQARALERGVDILVATPGRLLDLMNQRVADISKVEVLVVDEADQMFDMGFLRDLERIVSRVPLDRQTLMFSATMPEPIRELADKWLYEPKYVKVSPVSSASELVSQSVFHVELQNKAKLLARYLKSSSVTRAIVFARTKHGADDLVKVLMKNGIQAVAIHGNKSQNARTRHLDQFKSDRPPVLVATDIAARGIDVSGVSHVINYQLPEVPEIYVHRIGRTGRAEASGVAVSFCGPDERGCLRDIERLTGKEIEVNESFPEFTYTPSASMSSGAKSSKGARGGRNAKSSQGVSLRKKVKRAPSGVSSSSRPRTQGGARTQRTSSPRSAPR
jgi:ATP-dependent RNA helicase RhlE